MATTSVGRDWLPRALGWDVGRVLLFVALLAGLSYVSFPLPFSPGIPVDFQVVGVFLAALLLGPGRGTAAVLGFLVVGVAGVPVFDVGTGLDTVLGSPKVGYYLAYPAAAALVGYLVHRGTSLRDLESVRLRSLVGALLAGTAVISVGFTIGYAATMDVGLGTTFFLATLPFFPTELVKILVAVGVVRHDLLVPN
jgi:biotin transport system substrate-specific component